MTGISTTHPLRDDVAAIIDVGTTVREIISQTELTTTAALISDDPDLGTARHFTEDGQLTGSINISTNSTVVFIYKLFGSASAGDNGRIRFVDYILNGDQFRFEQSGYLAYDYRLNLRSNFSSSINTDYQPYNRQPEPRAVPKVSAIAYTTGTPVFWQNGEQVTSVAGGSATGQPFNANPIAVTFMPSVASLASVYLSGIIIFDKILNSSEMESITTDPWAITNGVVPATLELSGVLQPSATITATIANFDNPPNQAVITDSNDNTLILPLTDIGNSQYTFTMPDLPTTGSSAGLLFGQVSVTLNNEGE